MDYTELVKSLRICGEWGTEVRIPGEPSECDGCSYYNAEKDECKSWDEPWRKEHLLLDAADAIEELQKNRVCRIVEKEGETELFVENRWIPVTERLPEKNQIVVVVQHGKTWDYGQFRGLAYLGGNIHKWNWKNNTTKTVDYWMPKKSALPEPPKEETE